MLSLVILEEGSDKYLEFLEHWAEVLDACVMTIRGQSSDSIQAEMCLSHASSMSSWFHFRELS